MNESPEEGSIAPNSEPQAGAPGVTSAAFEQIRKITAGANAGQMLRVSILGGGCSGFQYDFKLESSAEPDDLRIEDDGAVVLIDPVSLPFLSGAVIDFKRELIGARFTIDNPNATATCGCGTSFAV
ncbi:MAG: iron-sulfur cluster insertion protein ErpA [Neomegalonema sp.]|nr:iron-sulfur cluster insertion protein ErpA [Neomegalonema sp.]